MLKWSATASSIIVLRLFIHLIASTYLNSTCTSIVTIVRAHLSGSAHTRVRHRSHIICMNTLRLQVMNYQLRDLRKNFCNIVPRFCACFKKRKAMLLSKCSSSLRIYFLLIIWHVRFVCYKNLLNIWLSMSLNLF